MTENNFSRLCAHYGVSVSEGIATAVLVTAAEPLVKDTASLLYGTEQVTKLIEGRIAPEGRVQ